MTATRRSGGFGRSAGDAALRGALLVAVAVIIGAVLIWKGSGDDKPSSLATDGGSTLPTGNNTTTRKGQPANTTPTTAAPAQIRPKEQVKVLVANGVGSAKPNYAGLVRTKLVTAKWAVSNAINAKVGQPSTQIFYAEGYLNEAKELAKDLATDVQPGLVPVDLSQYLDANGVNNAQAVNIVVILGLDDKVKV